MATVAVSPFVLRDVEFTVEDDDYAKHVSTVQFVPDVASLTWQGLTPDAAFTDVGSPTWTCKIDYAQDWTTSGSFSQYLMDNAGQRKTVTFKPLGAATGKPVFTATLTITPGPIGGDVNTVQVGEVTLGVVGAPDRTVVA